GKKQAFSKLKDAEAETPTVDMDEATALRELKKLEPAFTAWKDLIGKAGPVAGLAPVQSLSRALSVYYSVSDPAQKLGAFQKAGLLDKSKTTANLVDYLVRLITAAATAIAEEGLRAAKKAGNGGAVMVIQKVLSEVPYLRAPARIFGIAKGLYEVIHGIHSGDWEKIA